MLKWTLAIAGLCRMFLFVVVCGASSVLSHVTFAADNVVVRGGRAHAVVVVGHDAPQFDRWVAAELRRCLQELSGAQLAIVTHDNLPADDLLIALGRPESNPLVAAAQKQGLVNFSGLKPEGLILKTVELDGRPAIVVGGSDETGTMYAAYEFLERLGIVFQLTNDIIPQKKPDLAVPALDVRLEPQLKYRGMHCCHGLRWYMGLEDFRKHIDQMAKLKLNCLQFYWGIGGSPWLKFSYDGKVAEIFYPKESGYVAWGGPGALNTSGTAKEIRVGRECFPRDYLGPPEFADVRTPEQAFTTASDFLRQVIRYAHQRKVQVWLMLGEIPRVPPNLVPKTGGAPKGFGGVFYCGRLLPHGDPAVLDIWEAAVESLIETYPEADGYGVWTTEDRPSVDFPETQELIGQYADARKLIPSVQEIRQQGNHHLKDAQGLESDFAEVCLVDRFVRRIRARHPKVKLGVALLFRGYLLRVLDSLLPKDVWLMNMETYANTKSVMHFYDGIEGRELLTMPRIDDDGCELHMQLGAMMYDRDKIIPGSAKYGLAGVVGQLNKERGLECNARYMAEGAWNPKIDCRSFYQGYLSRIYGPDALETLLKAFLLLEENDKVLGWSNHGGIFPGYRRFSPIRFPPTTGPLRGAKAKGQREELEKATGTALGTQKRWTDMAARYREALELLRQAKPKILPGAAEELDYVIYKTESFAGYLDALAAGYEAVAAFNRALLLEGSGDEADMLKRFEPARAAVNRADCRAREVARQMMAYADIPTEKYLLFRFNQNVIASIEGLARMLRNAMALPALIAHWTFDSADGSTVPFTGDVDGSIVTFEGTLTRTGKIDTNGGALIGSGAYLGANDPDNNSGISLAGTTVGSDGRTRLGDQLDLAGVSSMTFAAWIRSSRASEYGTLFHAYGAPGYSGYGIQTWPNTGRPRYHPGWSENPYYDNGTPGPPNVMEGDWHHLVVTADGAAVKFYVNGKTQTDWRKTQTAISHRSYTGDRFIGHHADTEYDSQIVGHLDDMGIWRNKVLSATEVALLHGLGRVQGSDLSYLDEGVALWAGGADAKASIDGVLWKKATGLQGSLGDWGGSKDGHDGYVVLDGSGGGIRMMLP